MKRDKIRHKSQTKCLQKASRGSTGQTFPDRQLPAKLKIIHSFWIRTEIFQQA